MKNIIDRYLVTNEDVLLDRINEKKSHEEDEISSQEKSIIKRVATLLNTVKKPYELSLLISVTSLVNAAALGNDHAKRNKIYAIARQLLGIANSK